MTERRRRYGFFAAHNAGRRDVDIAAEAGNSILDRQVPESEGKLTQALEKLEAELATGRSVVLHCRQGIGRTGLVAACLLLTKGLDPETAVKRLSAARGVPVPETPEQRRWIDHYAIRFAGVRLCV